MSYKPLSDDKLDWTSHWEARRVYREIIVEQLKRANRLAAAVKRLRFNVYRDIESEVVDALASYLGEDEPAEGET
jgi:signal recognition particle subunit SEC65